jgi:hypothetical protein
MSVFARRLFLVGTPLALAVVLWFHPPGGENVYEGVRDDVGAWLFVHTAFLLFTPLIAIAAYLLLGGLKSRAATVSRLALTFFLVFYTAWEVTVGVGTGILVDYANGLPAAEQLWSPTRSRTTTGTPSSPIRRFRSSSVPSGGWWRWSRRLSHSTEPERAGP